MVKEDIEKPNLIYIPKRTANELKFRGCDVGKDILNLPRIGSFISNEDLALILFINDRNVILKKDGKTLPGFRCGMGSKELSDKWRDSAEGNDTYTQILVDANILLEVLRKSADNYDKVFDSTLSPEDYTVELEKTTYEANQEHEFLSFYKGENCVVVAFNTDFNLLDDTDRIMEQSVLSNVLKMLYGFTSITSVSKSDVFRYYVRNVLTRKLSFNC